MTVRLTEEGMVLENSSLPINSKRLALNIEISDSVKNKTRRWNVRNKIAIQVVLMNLIACNEKKQRLFYSRQKDSRQKWKYNVRGLNALDIIKAIDELELMGYVYNYIADRQYLYSEEDKLPSWVKATDSLVSKFCTDETDCQKAEKAYIAANLNIEVREFKSKKKVDYVISDETREIERVVLFLNDMNSNHLFLTKDGEVIENVYTRIFNESLKYGGRFYRAGILNMPNKANKDRLRTTIDGESVYEIDFDCLHISILADESGVADKYEGDIYYKVLEPEQYSLANRALVKLAVNICLNATSVTSAAKAINKQIGKYPENTFCFTCGYAVIRQIKLKLPDFVQAFCNKKSTGKRLQNIDSWIAHYVVDEFIKIQQPILIIHDSFMVQRKNAGKLVDAMTAAYKKVVKVDKIVRMKMNWVENDEVQATDCSK